VIARSSLAGVVVAALATPARGQPVKDDHQLAEALITEGAKQLQAKAYDQALANFLEAYGKVPSPKVLLDIASTLRAMGRLADAANTYQRYLLDPATGLERVAEVKDLLLGLDEQLTILTVRVSPRGAELSLDAGPFIPIGSSLLTRVRPGIHLVRIRKGDQSNEVTVNGFEGERKDVSAALPGVVAEVTPPPVDVQPPDHVDGWLITGTQYSTDSGTGNSRKVRAGYQGPEITAIVPHDEPAHEGAALVPTPTEASISSGVIGVMRFDGKFRGFAGGVGLAIARAGFEVEIMFLRSDVTGGYLGGRYRLLTGVFHPYAAVGMPGFVFDETSTMGESTKKLAVGLRGAAGIELMLTGHLSVQADLGYEHFFNVANTHFEADLFVPTLGVIGRL
jgi:hypothetical protein